MQQAQSNRLTLTREAIRSRQIGTGGKRTCRFVMNVSFLKARLFPVWFSGKRDVSFCHDFSFRMSDVSFGALESFDDDHDDDDVVVTWLWKVFLSVRRPCKKSERAETRSRNWMWRIGACRAYTVQDEKHWCVCTYMKIWIQIHARALCRWLALVPCLFKGHKNLLSHMRVSV